MILAGIESSSSDSSDYTEFEYTDIEPEDDVEHGKKLKINFLERIY